MLPTPQRATTAALTLVLATEARASRRASESQRSSRLSNRNIPRACLELDDVEALATLYPDCSGQSLSVVTCHKVAHNIGIVRVALYVLVPLLLALVGILACAALVRLHLARELVKSRQQREDFVVDDDDLGYADDGEDHLLNDQQQKGGRRNSGASSSSQVLLLPLHARPRPPLSSTAPTIDTRIPPVTDCLYD